MNTPIRRTRASFVGLVVIAALACVPVLASPASAATSGPQIGELTFYPGTGRDIDPMYVITSGPCPAAATAVVADISGGGLPAGTVVVPNGPAGLSRTDRFIEPLQDTLNGFAAQVGAKLGGPYTVTLKCQDKFGQKVYSTFVGVITFSDPTHYTAKETPLVMPSPEGTTTAATNTNPSIKTAPGTATSHPSGIPQGSVPNNPTSSVATPSGAMSGGVATSPSGSPISIAGGDTNVPSPTVAVSNLTEGGFSHWIPFALGLLLVLLGFGWVVRGRASRSVDGPAPDAVEHRLDEHV